MDAGRELPSHGFVRSIGLLQGTAINMTQMVGIGPFVTIPLMVAAFGGPQAIMGWILGAILALADGLVWAELGAAMPGAGGTYLYLREAFQYRTGRLMPFMFVWSALLFIPLIMSTGVVGLVQYTTYLWPTMTDWESKVLSIVISVVVVALLYRRIESIGKITVVLWVVMLASVALVTIAAFSHFNPSLAFTYPADAFTPNTKFFLGLGGGLVIGIYDYLGYNTTAYIADEVERPGRVLPFSIIVSIIAIMTVYLLMNVGVLGVMPAAKVAGATSIASVVLEQTWGKAAADVVTVLIIITGFASVFCGLLGGSRVPFNAAHDRVFLKWFGNMHPTLRFPHVSLLVMGAIMAVASLLPLALLISTLTAVFVIVQSLGQIVALFVLRRRQPNLPRPYRMWLYPVPAVVAFVLWVGTYFASGSQASPQWVPIYLSIVWLVVGIAAYLVYARVERTWPFGPTEITEEYAQSSEVATPTA
ncbi:MAG TPA: APC family permease [Terriglobales bacterium]|nr:APC family permease [Terriglobales bacterium]